MKKKIAIDVDGVVADLFDKWVGVYNERWNDNIKPEDVKGWFLDEYVKPECGKQVFDILHEPGFFSDLKPIDGAQEAVYLLSRYYKVYFVTSATSIPNSVKDKLNWLRRHFPFISHRNIVLCGSKEIINADFMVDDGVHNLESFYEANPNGKGLLFDAPYNRGYEDATRITDWKHALDFFNLDREYRQAFTGVK